MRRFLNWLIFIAVFVVFVLLGAAFTVKNSQPVTVDFYVIQPSLPIALWLALAMLVGVVMTWIALGLRLVRLGIESRRNARKVEVANREIANLRALPGNDAS